MRRAVVVGAVAIAAGAGGYLALSGGGGGSPAPRASGARSPSRLLSPARFAAVVGRRRVVTINVHTPDEGSIPGTDVELPYDRIPARRAELPPGSTPIAIYCRSGRMSAIAARTLSRMGFRTIFELSGGMFAWEASGRRLLRT